MEQQMTLAGPNVAADASAAIGIGVGVSVAGSIGNNKLDENNNNIEIMTNLDLAGEPVDQLFDNHTSINQQQVAPTMHQANYQNNQQEKVMLQQLSSSSVTSNNNNTSTVTQSSEATSSNRNNHTPKPRGRRKKIRTEPIRPICPQCEKQFSNQSALTKHKLTHSDERKFACQQCSKAFKRHDHLTGHMQTHSNRKPFNCTIQGCDKTYCDARSLRRHKENIHHIVTPKDNNSNGCGSSNSNSNSNGCDDNKLTSNGIQQQHQQQLQQSQQLNHQATSPTTPTMKLIGYSSTGNLSSLHLGGGNHHNTHFTTNNHHQHPQQQQQPHHHHHHHASHNQLHIQHPHQQQHQHSLNHNHHHISYSADYASTQHFTFDHIGDHTGESGSIADSGLGLNLPTPTSGFLTPQPQPPLQQHQQQQPTQPTNDYSLVGSSTQSGPPSFTSSSSNTSTYQPSHLLSRRIQRLHSNPEYPGAYRTIETSRHYLQQQQQHAYSADYASTQQFTFDFNQMAEPVPFIDSNTNTTNIADSGLELNVHYEQPQPMQTPGNASSNLHHQHQHQQQHPHHNQDRIPPYSADYAISQHQQQFTFDYDGANTTLLPLSSCTNGGCDGGDTTPNLSNNNNNNGQTSVIQGNQHNHCCCTSSTSLNNNSNNTANHNQRIC